MDEQQAIAVARAYAEAWGVPWPEDLAAEPVRDRWMEIVAFRLTARRAGALYVTVEQPGPRVTCFEWYPVDGSRMLPRWAAYPEYDAFTHGWRSGAGESYALRWHRWFAGLPRTERKAYEQVYPAPRERGWGDFYEYLPDRA